MSPGRPVQQQLRGQGRQAVCGRRPVDLLPVCTLLKLAAIREDYAIHSLAIRGPRLVTVQLDTGHVVFAQAATEQHGLGIHYALLAGVLGNIKRTDEK